MLCETTQPTYLELLKWWGLKMKFVCGFAILMFILLSGCGYSQTDLNSSYEKGYIEGYTDRGEEIDKIAEMYEDYSWSDGYDKGLYDGYQERKKGEKAGAPDYYDDYEEWYKFWFGIYPSDIKNHFNLER